MSNEEKGRILIIAILVILIMVCGIGYAVFQYNLCYPEVSDSVWYCIQHAVN